MAKGAVGAPTQAPMASDGSEQALQRRQLPQWDKRRTPGLMPQPMPGSGPRGEALAAALHAYHPVVRDMVNGDGYVLAQAGTGECLNEEDYTVNEQGHLIYKDAAVYIRSKEWDDRARAEEAEASRRYAARLDLPSVMREGDTEVHTRAQEVRTTALEDLPED